MSTPDATSPTDFDLEPVASPLGDEERAERMKSLGFGRIFTEHMVTIPYSKASGWGRGRLVPFGPIPLSPAASVLHYGQAVFEGFKAYRQPDGSIKSFRPQDNAERFARSAQRLAMPPLPVESFMAAADLLISHDRAWVPSGPGESLYLRPLMIATEGALGVRPAREFLFVVMASPVASYFPNGVQPVTVWVSEEHCRAAPGGTGDAKCAGNYAASLLAQMQAAQEGCSQVVWLDAVHRRYVEEMGGMNICFVSHESGRPVLVTPSLTGTLLPGVTRDSLLKLAETLGYGAEERLVSVDEWRDASADGRMTEAFACGTAAVVTPIGAVKSRRGSWTIHNNETGPVAATLRKELLDIQFGRGPDNFGWMHRVVDAPPPVHRAADGPPPAQ